MKKKRPEITLSFPAGTHDALQRIAQLEDLHPDRLALTLWQLQRQIVRRIIAKEGDVTDGDLTARLHSKVLVKAIGNDYAKHLWALRDNGVIIMVENYLSGCRSRSFTYSRQFDPLGPQDKYTLTKPAVINAFTRKFTVNEGSQDPLFLQRKAYLHRFDIDERAARGWVQEQARQRSHPAPWHGHMETTIDILVNGFRRLHRSRWGREHSSFSNIPKEMRRSHLHCDGESLRELDIEACHVLLLFSMMSPRYPKEKTIMLEALQHGFYTWLAEQIGTQADRDQVKKEFFLFLNKKRESRSPTARIFRANFPRLTQGLRYAKDVKGHQFVARQLQARESNLMRAICHDVQTTHPALPFFTVYDALVTADSAADQVEAIAIDTLHRYGFTWLRSLTKVKKL